MPNLLNLRKEPKPIIIEKIIQEKRVWWLEVLKMVTVITVVTSIVYGVSRADIIIQTPEAAPSESWTGIYGTVTSMSGNSLILDDSQGSKYPGVDIFNVDLTNVKTVETNDDNPISLSVTDINAGDKIIARGIIDGDNLDAHDIISFSYVKVTATTTEASSTDATTTEATSTTPVEATSTSVEATSTSVEASSTDSISTATTTEATTTDSVATTTDESSSATSTDDSDASTTTN